MKKKEKMKDYFKRLLVPYKFEDAIKSTNLYGTNAAEASSRRANAERLFLRGRKPIADSNTRAGSKTSVKVEHARKRFSIRSFLKEALMGCGRQPTLGIILTAAVVTAYVYCVPPSASVYASASASASEVQSTIAASYAHSMAIKADGSLFAWGFNYDGRIGDGTREHSYSPVKVMDDVRTVAAGYTHSMAVKADGSLFAWGDNYYGRLGDGTTDERLLPVKVMDGVRSVSAGENHSMAIKTDGSLWAWGYNGSGELGDGTTQNRLSPVKIMDGVISVSLGYSHSMAVKTDGSLMVWGYNIDGRLGDGTTEERLSPVKIMSGVKTAAAGVYHSMALKNDGSLWAWGNNADGRLGDGTASSDDTPFKIMDGVSSVSVGEYHSMAIKTDGSLWVWGDNGDGRLGDGTTEDRYSPVKVMDGVRSVAAGDYHSMALKNDGSLWAWGDSEYGQIGDGTTNDRHTPIKVLDGVMLPGNASAAPVTPTLPVVPTPSAPPFTPEVPADSDNNSTAGDEAPNGANTPSSWAVESVDAAIAANLVPDTLQSNYTQTTTRAEFAALAVALYENVSGAEITERAAFSDTNDVNVEKAAAIGVVAGVGGNMFAPGARLTREQAAVMLARLAEALEQPLEGNTASFADYGSISPWALAQVGQIQAAGIMSGVGGGLFAPQEPYTREQSIITVMRLYDNIEFVI